MAQSNVNEFNTEVPRYSEFRRIVRVFLGNKLAVIGLAIILVLIIVAMFAPLIATHNPYDTNVTQRLLPPSGEHLLGTDTVGRDTFSRIVYGAQTSLLVGILSVGSATIISVTLGLLAASMGGWVQAIIMRMMDALMAIPGLMLALLIAGLIGGGITIVIISMIIMQIPGLTRLMCGQALSIKQNDYVPSGTNDRHEPDAHHVDSIFPNASRRY
jgi:peptide/nickel transport system permease protein